MTLNPQVDEDEHPESQRHVLEFGEVAKSIRVPKRCNDGVEFGTRFGYRMSDVARRKGLSATTLVTRIGDRLYRAVDAEILEESLDEGSSWRDVTPSGLDAVQWIKSDGLGRVWVGSDSLVAVLEQPGTWSMVTPKDPMFDDVLVLEGEIGLHYRDRQLVVFPRPNQPQSDWRRLSLKVKLWALGEFPVAGIVGRTRLGEVVVLDRDGQVSEKMPSDENVTFGLGKWVRWKFETSEEAKSTTRGFTVALNWYVENCFRTELAALRKQVKEANSDQFYTWKGSVTDGKNIVIYGAVSGTNTVYVNTVLVLNSEGVYVTLGGEFGAVPMANGVFWILGQGIRPLRTLH